MLCQIIVMFNREEFTNVLIRLSKRGARISVDKD